jgi:Kef-type K+ transport system membrane component KefB/Trk K+ transport system NAD-binding subunit
MSDQAPFVPLLVITLLALAVPVVTSRVRAFRLPIVVGEIVAGMIIGDSGLGLVRPSPVLDFLAEFGFTFLMFLSGLEVRLESLSVAAAGGSRAERWRRPSTLALSVFALTVAMAVAVGFALSAAGLTRTPVLMGLILSTTSLGIVVPILKERGLTASLYGQTVLLAALVSDFATLLLLSVTIAVLGSGFTPDLLLVLVLLAVFVVAVRLVRRATKSAALARLADELSHATAQIRVRGAFALMVIWVALADAIGVEVILGAFLAGAILSIAGGGNASPLPEKLDAIGYGFFVPIFFITVGARFDLESLLASRSALALVGVLIAAAYAVKLVPSLLFRALFPLRESLAAGTLLSTRLSLIIAASSIALERGLIDAATNSAVILLAIVTCVVSPVLFGRLLPVTDGPRREGVVVLGTDQLAMLVGQRLRDSGERVTFIGRDQVQLDRLRDAGFPTVAGEPADEAVLASAGLATARAVVALTNAPDVALFVCRLARERFGVPVLVARADEQNAAARLSEIGVRVVYPSLAVALALEGALLFPAAFAMLLEKTDGVEIADVSVDDPEFARRPLRRLRLPGDALVAGIRRDGEVVVPHGDTALDRGDVLFVVGSAESIRETRALLAASPRGSR